MKPQFISDLEVRAKIEPRKVLKSLESAFCQLALSKATQPAQHSMLLPQAGGDTIFYPAALATPCLIGLTASPYILKRLDNGLSPVTAYSLILCGESGQLIAVIESGSLIAARTGATTWLAASKLARRIDKVAIIGSGEVAQWHLRQLRDSACGSICVFSPNLLSSGAKSRREALVALDERVRFATTAQEAVDSAGLVMLCTAACTPVIDLAWTAPDVLLTSISTDGVNAHEVQPSELFELDVYCDYRPLTPEVAGEMILATSQHGWNESSIVADLPELLSAKDLAYPLSGKRRFFRSVGLGIEDLAAATTLLAELSGMAGAEV